MRRREFIKIGGLFLSAGAAGTAVAACGTGTASRPLRTTSAPPRTTRAPPRTSAPRPGDWATLGRSIEGRLVLPSSPAYATDVQSYNPVFDGARPKAIAYVASPADVSTAVAFGRDHGIQLSIRSGGHCYGGWSTGSGLVIDVSELSQVSIARAGTLSGVEVATGSGTRLVDLYAACAGDGVAVPGGSCPTVGIAGLALGGGLGVLDRKLGLTCDRMLSAEIVLASGEVASCDSSTRPDLFWALRGAGGGSFGVVTELRLAASTIGDLGLFTLEWSWSAAPQVVAAWQDWAPTAPDELWSNCLLFASQDTPSGYGPAARVTGVYAGPEAALEAELSGFLSAISATPFTHFVGAAGYLDTMLVEAGCEGDTVAECHLPSENPAGILTRAPFAAKSDIVTARMPATAIARLLAAVEARQESPVLSGGGIVLDASGGAVNRVAPTATAFVHRDALFTMQYSANWATGDPPSVEAANHSWLQRSWQSMRPYVSGQAYQNYADPDLKDWAVAYYGENLPRLEQVKTRYDPDDVFHFAQSIPVWR